MWYFTIMNSTLEEDMLVDADMTSNGQFQILPSQNQHQSWAGPPMNFKSTNVSPESLPYHSFNWAPVDTVENHFTPPPLGELKEATSSFEYITSSEAMSSGSFMQYPDGDTFMNASHYMSPTYSSSHTGSGIRGKDRLRVPARRARPVRNSTGPKQESPTSSSGGLEVPSKPKLHRRHSDQSATSLQSNSHSAADKGPGSSSASNEAHIIAERRYRNNLNAKIAQIQTALQDARFRSHSNESYRSRGGTYFNAETGSHEMDATSPASSGGKDRRRKADILDEAAEFIRFADLELRHLSEEVQWLNQALAASQGPTYDPHRRHQA